VISHLEKTGIRLESGPGSPSSPSVGQMARAAPAKSAHVFINTAQTLRSSRNCVKRTATRRRISIRLPCRNGCVRRIGRSFGFCCVREHESPIFGFPSVPLQGSQTAESQQNMVGACGSRNGGQLNKPCALTALRPCF